MVHPAAGVDVLLFNYTGYPDYTSYFLADNGLAYLAACLRAAGHRPVIRDYVTMDTAERLHDPALFVRVREMRDRVRAEILDAGAPDPRTVEQALALDADVDLLNRRVALEIADELVLEIQRRDVRMLAVKLWSQPALRDVRAILESVRARCPEVRIIAGGGHVDYFEGSVLTDIAALDAAAAGDGETALVGYADWVAGRLTELGEVPNLFHRRDGRVEATARRESLTFRTDSHTPLYGSDVYPAVHAPASKMLTIGFEDSRGCQFACGFCAHPLKSGGLRLRPVDSVLEELAALNRDHGFVNFAGSGSNTPYLHASRLYQGMQDRGLDLAVNFFQSLRDFRVHKADVLRSAHIPLLWVGIETADQDLLIGTYDKRRNMEKTKEICEFLNENRIGYIMSLIYPSLGEDEDSTRNTVEFVQQVGLGHVVIYPPLLQPRTPWMDDQHVTWLDRQEFLRISQYGLEETENKVLPPMLGSSALNGSVLLNGRTYSEIYCQNVRFRAELDRVCGGTRGHQRNIGFTDELAPFMRQLNRTFAQTDRSLANGDFASARKEMTRFNELATAGSVARTRVLATGWDAPADPVAAPSFQMRTGGPA
ncbi:cobalamin-dependent protein [Streptomyces castrisilvae]|uniref:Cobalamin-dependent protein n=1 Tax=Streptomyces castrisilvae TaxID=3033811 RepID=A0ABY9HBV4_9ACTN|nr:cobalamin-dependent protein [Streptomyces sp. Mut1]WLQ31982.1 cobalamin-dependent protein [Streptomyces sp. Mut1]